MSGFLIQNKLKFLGITFFILTSHLSFAQDSPSSLMEEISYEYVERLIAIAKENYPRVKTHISNIKNAKTTITNAKMAWLTPLSLSYVYSPATTLNLSNPTFFSGYQVGFTLNLSSLLQTPGNISQAKEDLKVARYDQEEYLLSLTAEVKSRYFNYVKALKVLKYTSQSNSDVQNIFTRLKYKYERGEASFEEYNNVLIAANSSSQSKMDAEVALLTTKVSLEELLGIRLEEVPN